jgi:hypothetical protein
MWFEINKLFCVYETLKRPSEKSSNFHADRGFEYVNQKCKKQD